MFHRDQRDLLCCSGPISSDEQTRNHDDLLLRRFESGGKLGFFRCHHEHNGRKPGLEGLCGFCFFALAVVGQSTSEALDLSVLPSARICPYFYGNSTWNPQYGNAVVDSANLKKSKPISKSFNLKQISVSN